MAPARPPFEIGTPKQQQRYNKLSLWPILSNRFIDENALAKVGLRDAVLEPLKRIGAWNPVRLVYDIVGGGKGTRLNIDVMVHMRLVEKVGDAFCIVGSQEARPDVEETEEAGDNNMEEYIPHIFPEFGTFSVQVHLKLVLPLWKHPICLTKRNYAWEPRLLNRYHAKPILGNCQSTPNCDTVATVASTSTT
ncbi:hypothetical protein JCGZ_05247 [Jatropha curcas]|uniref:Uncharacterized protein n=1 Tax=Jatropha curcas TaxID=180498 RepID=A0A067J9Q8_JATCU|nr:hypothetical protein JCGZ_05247 [Jatropha curcas]